LQAKGAEMQLKKKTDYIAELGKHMNTRRLAKENDLASIPPLKNANMNRGRRFSAHMWFLFLYVINCSCDHP
jgi:hypothetical protein